MSRNFLPKIVPFIEIMWKNAVQPERSQIHNKPHELCMLNNYGY